MSTALTVRRAARRLALACAAAALPLAAQPAAPAAPEAAPEPTHWYEVQPGDNLHVIAGHLLGDRAQWTRVRRLNPEIEDPDVLRPGQRIRVPGAEPDTAPADAAGPPVVQAELSRLSQRVEEQPHPQGYWAPASVGDRLKERDGLRTHEKASAELAFGDGSRYLVSERSLLFLRAPAQGAGARRARSIEVVAGQADVEVQPAPQGPREIEILVAGSRSRTRPGRDETGQARARRADSGTAQLMIFGGAGEVSAQGVKVDVPRGMGTSIPAGGVPAPPEKLLGAPAPIGPADGAVFEYANPIFSWAPVPGAASYTVEVCRDAACGELVDRATGLADVRWANDGLPLGDFHWRVIPVSGSGLDGYASATARFSVRAHWRRPFPARRRLPAASEQAPSGAPRDTQPGPTASPSSARPGA